MFTSLALVNLLIMPLNAFPWVLNGLVEALVSLRRLEKFFDLSNVDLPSVYSLVRGLSLSISHSPLLDNENLLEVREGNFYWSGSSSTVSGVTFDGKPVSREVVEGPLLGRSDRHYRRCRSRQVHSAPRTSC